MNGRWPFVLFAGLLLASLLLVGGLGRTVFSDLRVLSTAQNDDVSWTMSQLEVELLRLQTAVLSAQADETAGLGEVRKRFDIFYSRITTIRQSSFFAPLAQEATIAGSTAAAAAFLDRSIPFVDGADDDLRGHLPEILAEIDGLRPKVRALALAGVEHFTTQETADRDRLSVTLQRLAYGLTALIAVLFLALASLIQLYRQGQRASQNREQARARFEAVVSSSLNAVLVADTQGHVVEFNGAAETVFGYTRDEALGADMAELIVPEELREAHRAGLKRFVETGERRVIGAGRVRLKGMRKGGEVFPVELSISVSEASGETVFVSFLRDITKELKAEEDLKDALEKAQVGEKAKSNLLTVMSHEMRTPLNGILGSLELMDQSNLSDAQKRHLASIGISGELLLSHVNDVLDLSALTSEAEAPKHAPFNLKDLVQDVVNSLQSNASKHANALSVDFLTEDLQTVNGDRSSLQRCLVNLVGNALKFTRDGRVSIEIERLASGDVVEFRVADTGVGIAPENLSRIFEEFVTIDTAFDRENSGTGLGLAITKRLIERNGGELEADSLLGEGSLFTFRLPLPLTTDVADLQTHSSAHSLPDLPAGFRALVVDDNDINREILTDIVRDLGGVTQETSNGFEAIAICEAADFDVLLLDISMPGIDGLETLKRIRKGASPNVATPAVAVTAHAAPKDHEAILAQDFQTLILKPVRRAAIQGALADVFGVRDSGAEFTDTTQDAPEFLKQFGLERYTEAVRETQGEISQLLTGKQVTDPLTEADREEAHRLSGSAAVLGWMDLWSALQAVQNAPEDHWDEHLLLLQAEFDRVFPDQMRQP
ncbi:PAS domain-containing hybrid sensor histidine kinase/response regulator [uncultured Shimia sp.]|uniref:hybrid sensor histidine kinase/response regulator n=1 Tax=uncultured Shimia sp. TaxID=573152 RepID=UPI0026082C03|nr:PAS domain-containing hybrid sensor histidine kinase/response regulator [uncultured Shimia sp.]